MSWFVLKVVVVLVRASERTSFSISSKAGNQSWSVGTTTRTSLFRSFYHRVVLPTGKATLSCLRRSMCYCMAHFFFTNWRCVHFIHVSLSTSKYLPGSGFNYNIFGEKSLKIHRVFNFLMDRIRRWNCKGFQRFNIISSTKTLREIHISLIINPTVSATSSIVQIMEIPILIEVWQPETENFLSVLWQETRKSIMTPVYTKKIKHIILVHSMTLLG